MPSDEAKIQAILEDILTSGSSAEDGCCNDPNLLPEIKERLAQMRVLEAHLDEVLPVTGIPDLLWHTAVDGAPADLPVIPGYEVEAVVGSGGMGVVYRGRHLKLNRTVAIKMLLAGSYASPRDLERFKREAESIAALQHPNIVQVFDAGDCAGRPYFVMEFMEGGTLAQGLAGTPQPVRATAELIRSLAIAMHAAHTAGIVHRDLKPGNLLLSADGAVKVADFGLAGRSNPEGSAITSVGVRMGTPSYMAPEQATGAPTASSPLVDVYALGAILYEMATGRPPFRGDNAAETERQVVTAEPVPPSRLNPKTPRDLQTITLRCLHKDPSRRYRSAAELAEDLRRFLRGDAILARPVGRIERVVKWCRRQPARAALIAALLIAMAATIVIGLRLQSVKADRRADAAIRQERAQLAVESALSLAESLRRSERWAEAENVLGNAKSRLPDADAPDLEARLASETDNLGIARELDRIGQGFPEPYNEGYNFSQAREGYAKVFEQLGMGLGVGVEEGAQRVRASPLREHLLTALDTAALIETVGNETAEQKRLLSMARLADPDPWRDRFRDPTLWGDRKALLSLVEEGRSPSVKAPAHEIVILAVLLSRLGDNAKAVEILREAQYQHPSDFWINLELGNALIRAGKHAEAIQFYRSAVALRPSHYAAWETLGTEVATTESPAAAIPLFRRVAELNPRHAINWQNLALALSQCERWEDAQDAMKRAAELNPGDPHLDGTRAQCSLIHGRSLASTGDWQAAAKLYAEALAHNYADDGQAWFEYSAVLLLADDAKGYRQACKYMVERGEAGRMWKFLSARSWTLAANPRAEFDRVNQMGMQELSKNASEHWCLTEQAALTYRQGRYEEVVPLLQQSIAAKPAGAFLNWAWLACVEAGQGHQDAAREWLGKTKAWRDQAGNKIPEGVHLHDWLEAQVLYREAASAPGG